jgi:hypothetical protein
MKIYSKCPICDYSLRPTYTGQSVNYRCSNYIDPYHFLQSVVKDFLWSQNFNFDIVNKNYYIAINYKENYSYINTTIFGHSKRPLTLIDKALKFSSLQNLANQCDLLLLFS